MMTSMITATLKNLLLVAVSSPSFYSDVPRSDVGENFVLFLPSSITRGIYPNLHLLLVASIIAKMGVVPLLSK